MTLSRINEGLDLKRLGTQIRALRESNNMSQRELAHKLGVSYGLISLWESGDRQPLLDNLVRLANVFSVSVTELIGV